jgi:hypothetical protein
MKLNPKNCFGSFHSGRNSMRTLWERQVKASAACDSITKLFLRQDSLCTSKQREAEEELENEAKL